MPMKPIIDKIKKINVNSSINMSPINFISPNEKNYRAKSANGNTNKIQVFIVIEKAIDHDHDQNTLADVIQILGRVFFLLRIYAFNIYFCLAVFNSIKGFIDTYPFILRIRLLQLKTQIQDMTTKHTKYTKKRMYPFRVFRGDFVWFKFLEISNIFG
ncbi:MAG: hypothetical protein HZA01_07165 [Nitrospinae bacterium]|nr:hypothetical protein [Nitrospinota bacterium]